MQLSPNQITRLLSAMEKSFGPFEMERLMVERFGLKLQNIASPYKKFSDQVVDIHQHFDQHNTTEELVAALRDARPNIPAFVTLADECGFTLLPGKKGLEILIRKARVPFQDAEDFRTKLAAIENCVCRIETAHGYGTGFLVGDQLAITNHHVVAAVLAENGSLRSRVTCLFDHKKSPSGYTTPVRRVEVSAVLASSPPADEDFIAGGTACDKSKLDYALLALDQDVGAQPIVPGGLVRGFVALSKNIHLPVENDGLLVVQHPGGREMKVDLGSVTWTNEIRLRHTVNTQPGSSGSPVLDSGVNVVAIHHVGCDWPRPNVPYNQAIPITAIVSDAEVKKVKL